MRMRRYFPTLLFLLSAASVLAESTPPDESFEEPVIAPWVESSYSLPPFPKDENLAEFSVDGAPNSKAYVDKTAISIGTNDKVVRYVLVVKTSGGATNVSYEGLRCDTDEYRIYATGTLENTWSKSRVSEWRPFRIHNRPQRSLASYYFCPNRTPIRTAEEGLTALRLGMHPAAARQLYRDI